MTAFEWFWLSLLLLVLLASFLGAREQRRSGLAGWVYFIDDGEAAIKIGVTEGEPDERMLALQTGNERDLRLTHTIWTDDRYKLENQLHHELDYCHIRGEWFEREPVLAHIAHLKGEW